MKYRHTIPAIALLLVWIFQCPAPVNAQDPQTDTPPKPAAKAYPPIGSGNDQESDQLPIAIQPDDRPITGLQDLTVGTAPEKHSYWIPGISYTNVIQSNALALGGGDSWNSTSYIAGNLSLLQNWSSSQLSVNYSGGGVLSSDSAIGNGQFQQLSVVQTFDWRRVKLTFLDQFSYLPQAQFGFGAGSGLANPGVGGSLAPSLPGLQSGFTPGQSIFTAAGPQYSNSSAAQLNYALTPRSSVTIGGVFSILRYTDSGNIESNEVVLNAGYNLQVSKTDTIGLSYRFSAYEFIGSPQAMGIHVVQVVYGKKITGRLALQVAGGPEITNYRVPPGLGTNTEYISGAGSAGLTYAFSAGNVSLNYNHGTNNGSGVLVGATSDQLMGSGTVKLTRVWSGNASFGFARNTSVAGSNGTQSPAYNTLYIGAGLQRPISRTANLTLNYTANIQTSSNTVCAGSNCDTNFTTHAITLGLNWHTRPFVLR